MKWDGPVWIHFCLWLVPYHLAYVCLFICVPVCEHVLERMKRIAFSALFLKFWLLSEKYKKKKTKCLYLFCTCSNTMLILVLCQNFHCILCCLCVCLCDLSELYFHREAKYDWLHIIPCIEFRQIVWNWLSEGVRSMSGLIGVRRDIHEYWFSGAS